MASGDECMELEQDGSDGCTPISSAKGMVARPVSPGDSGVGFPYAPEDWPNPGDKWKWKVGKRKSVSGYYIDRYLYLPDRLQKAPGRRSGFPSKLAVIQYIKNTFPNADINAFFASFMWKIPHTNKTALVLIEEGKNSSGVKLDTTEKSASESTFGAMNCKAGNKICSLRAQAEGCSPALMDCDICCSEAGFCRECCCILCCKTIDWEYGGYSFIRCEAKLKEDFMCGHVAHLNCALRSYMAGTVGGSIGLDAEYYCRRCDNKTDMVSHVTKLLNMCESLDSQDDIVKILNTGLCILRGSEKAGAKNLITHIEMVLTKLKSGVHDEEIWKMDDDLPAICTGEMSQLENSPTSLEPLVAVRDQDTMDLTTGSENEDDDICGKAQTPVYITSDHHTASLKFENEIDQALQSLKRSQELEYRTAEQKLYAHKDFLLGLYQQLDDERAELAKHTSTPTDGGDSSTPTEGSYSDTLLASVLNRVDQIKEEVIKLRQMMEISKGFGRTPRGILKEHYGITTDD